MTYREPGRISITAKAVFAHAKLRGAKWNPGRAYLPTLGLGGDRCNALPPLLQSILRLGDGTAELDLDYIRIWPYDEIVESLRARPQVIVGFADFMVYGQTYAFHLEDHSVYADAGGLPRLVAPSVEHFFELYLTRQLE